MAMGSDDPSHMEELLAESRPCIPPRLAHFDHPPLTIYLQGHLAVGVAEPHMGDRAREFELRFGRPAPPMVRPYAWGQERACNQRQQREPCPSFGKHMHGQSSALIVIVVLALQTDHVHTKFQGSRQAMVSEDMTLEDRTLVVLV